MRELSAPTVETKPMGRGTTALIMRLYKYPLSISAGSTVIMALSPPAPCMGPKGDG